MPSNAAAESEPHIQLTLNTLLLILHLKKADGKLFQNNTLLVSWSPFIMFQMSELLLLHLNFSDKLI